MRKNKINKYNKSSGQMETVFHWGTFGNPLCIKAAGREWKTWGWMEIKCINGVSYTVISRIFVMVIMHM